MKTKTVIEYDESGKKVRETIYNDETQNDLKLNQDKLPYSLDEIIETEKDKIDDETRKRLKDNVKLFYFKEKWKEYYDLVTRTNTITDKLEKLVNAMIVCSVLMAIYLLFFTVFIIVEKCS